MTPEQAAGKAGRQARRHLVVRRGAVGDAHRRASVRGGESVIAHARRRAARARRFREGAGRAAAALLRRCLDRDVKTRLRDIGEARVALGPCARSRIRCEAAANARLRRKRRGHVDRRHGSDDGAGGDAMWGWLTPAPSQARPVTHFITATPQGIATIRSRLAMMGRASPSSGPPATKSICRTMDNPAVRPVPGTEAAAPAFSPDGQSLAFLTGPPAPLQLRKVPVAGGAAQTLSRASRRRAAVVG